MKAMHPPPSYRADQMPGIPMTAAVCCVDVSAVWNNFWNCINEESNLVLFYRSSSQQYH